MGSESQRFLCLRIQASDSVTTYAFDDILLKCNRLLHC